MNDAKFNEEILKLMKDSLKDSIQEKFKVDAKNAYQTKSMAIEFAKYLFNQKIITQTSGRIGDEYELEGVHPPEFQLMLGNLEKDAEGMFKEFLNKTIYE